MKFTWGIGFAMGVILVTTACAASDGKSSGDGSGDDSARAGSINTVDDLPASSERQTDRDVVPAVSPYRANENEPIPNGAAVAAIRDKLGLAELGFNLQNYPRVDGSTSTIPLQFGDCLLAVQCAVEMGRIRVSRLR